jgi:hypothetical protein
MEPIYDLLAELAQASTASSGGSDASMVGNRRSIPRGLPESKRHATACSLTHLRLALYRAFAQSMHDTPKSPANRETESPQVVHLAPSHADPAF